MRVEDRIFLRVSKPVIMACKRLSRELGDRGASSIARTLIVNGCKNGSVPEIVPGPFREPMNVGFTPEQRVAIEIACEAESRRMGQQIDLSTFARRCLHRGLELEEGRNVSHRKAG